MLDFTFVSLFHFMKAKLGTLKYQDFKEKCPWDKSKVLGEKDLFDSLVLSEQTAFQILRVFLII